MKLLFFIFILICIPMKAQKKFSLDDITPGAEAQKKFVPKDFDLLQWETDSLILEHDSAIWSMRPKTQKQRFLCTLNQLNKSLQELNLPEQSKFPKFYFTTQKNELLFMLKEQVVYYNYKSNCISRWFKWKSSWENADYCAFNDCFALTYQNDLWLVSHDKRLRINSHSEKNVLYGQAVHRDEFGIHKGTFWSPKGKFLAFYRMDERMVSDYELVDYSKKRPLSKQIKYPAAGESSHEVSIGIYSIKTGKTQYLQTGEPLDRFFTNLVWSLDEKELYVSELNRAQNICTLRAYDIKTGIGRELFTERASSYVEPENAPFFIDSKQFVWQSERTGHNHLYLYNTNGELLKPLTSGNWDVLELAGYNATTAQLIICSTQASVLEKNPYALHIETGALRPLFTTGGQHMLKLSASGQFLIDSHQSIQIPRKIDLLSISDEKRVNLLQAPNPYAEFTMPQFKYGVIKAADGSTDLHYRITLPLDFDSAKQYPCIVHVYGGPHVQMVQNTWLGGSKGWELYMAQQGFVMFTLDNRGSMNRGQAFEEAVFKNIGRAPFEDQLKGVEFLKSLPYVDSSRMGVYGWSFGGFMSTQLMCKAPHVFKAGVAGGAVIDWRLYEVMYGERYMQTPVLNPEGYAENDLTQYAHKLEGQFMMIHCELDPVVGILNAQKFLDAAKNADKKVQFVRYQKHEHNVLGKERVGLFFTISNFFMKNLQDSR